MTEAILEENPEVAGEIKSEEVIRADTANVTGGVAEVQARVVNVQQGGIGRVSGEALTITVTQGGIGAMAARRADVSVKEGGIGAIAAQYAIVRDTVVSVLAAPSVKLEGNTRVLIDLRAGLVFGVVVGALMGVSNIVRRVVRPSK